ncbi:MAG: hypothetical protein R3C18_21070 [Planctomycetaceae bacterium]
MLSREEYIEQAYFFRTWRERLDNDTAAQELLVEIREEILTTTRLPMAIDFLAGEMQLHGRIAEGMQKLKHYFSPFQSFVVQMAELENTRFDFRIALEILEREAEYRSSDTVIPPALFVFQFECVARNRLGYDKGLLAISQDSLYPPNWKRWIERIRFQLGTVDFSDLVYRQSEQCLEDQKKQTGNEDLTAENVLFDRQAGRIARANMGKDPLYMFAALQRQLSYPAVPRPKPSSTRPLFDPQVELRFQRIESRMTMLEQEQKGGIDLTPYMKSPDGKSRPDFGSLE